MDLGELARRNARRYPNKICLVEGKKRYTFQEFNQRVNRLANALSALGVSKGDRVAILLFNCSEYAEIYFGLAKIGAVAVPLNTRLKAKEYVPYFRSCSCSVLFLGEQFIDEIREIRSSVETVKDFIIVRGSRREEEISYETLLLNSPSTEPSVEVDERDVAAIFFTSGTMGFPKGAMWTHRNILEQLINLQIDLPLSRDDIGLIVLPMFHGPVTVAMFHHLFYIGGSIVISPYLHFDSKDFLEVIRQEKITCTVIVPTILVQLINFPEIDLYREVIKQLKQIKYVAAPTSTEVLKKALDIFGPVFTQGYGLTETIGGVTFLSKEDHILIEGKNLDKKLKSCGREYINVHIKIVDENGREVPFGKVGEIVVKSDKNFAGYWKMPDETGNVLKNGWLYTGDLGMVDEERYFYIVDRKKDMIISGGENIYPLEIEEVINHHPKVKESAVIGVPDPLWGEAVKAVVVLKDGERATPQEIIDFCQEHLASYKKAKFVEFVDTLPKSSLGKVVKQILRDKNFRK